MLYFGNFFTDVSLFLHIGEILLLKLTKCGKYMCQVLWYLDVSYPLKIVIIAVKVVPKYNLVFETAVFKTHTYKRFQTWQQFFLET